MVELKGLSSSQVMARLQKFGPNILPEKETAPILVCLQKFWAPVPWMLEIVILVELILGKYGEAGVIGLLLLFNVILSFFQEGRAKNALRLLRSKLDVKARVLRDNEWKLLSAKGLVPEDIVCLRMGDIVPADAKLVQGHVLVDQSAITGESLPVEPEVEQNLYAGSIIKHGEAYAKITSTGTNTFYGKTAEIMRATLTPSHMEETIFSIIKYLVFFGALLVFVVAAYAVTHGISLVELIPFSLLLFTAAVPVALPATYTLSTALGSLELAKAGVLVTRLAAIEEAAAMNILCVDKTGTITQNILSVKTLLPYEPYSSDDLLCLASLCCEEATQDPIDLAILHAAKGNHSTFASAKLQQFTPFDPARKCSEALISYDGQNLHVVKGALRVLLKMVGKDTNALHDLDELSADGSRILGVAFGRKGDLNLVGLIALQDPPRDTSKGAIQEIHALGVKVIMVTGDEPHTAQSIGDQVEIGSRVISRDRLTREKILGNDIVAGVFPEDKFHIIELLQQGNDICGMTGDGVNDAPALKRAEVGIAMSNATDVAKSAASLVLTNPGLVDVTEAIKTSRRIYQRMLTYTLNKIIKTFEISLLLGLGVIVSNNLIISQMLIILLFFTNDFVTMSLSTDRVSFSQKPDSWDIRKLVCIGSGFACLILGLSFFILFIGEKFLHLSLPEIRTLVFLTLVFTGQATVYLIRERNHFWHSRPSSWLLFSSLCDVIIVSIMAAKGILMTPLAPSLIILLLISIVIYFFFLDLLKVQIFKIGRMA